VLGSLSHLGYFGFRRYVRGTKAMVPLVPPGRFVVVPCNPDAVRLLFSTCLILAVRVVLVGCDNFAKLDIVRLSTRVRTTRY
jgi:hypothetical protein